MKQLQRKKILVFAQGTIGDMITAMPAMKRVCDFHAGEIVHLHNTYPGENGVHRTLFDHLDWFDEMFFSQVPESLLSSPYQRLKNWFHIFREHYDIIYDFPGNFPNKKWMLRAFFPKKLCTLNSLEPNGVPRFRFLLKFLATQGIPRTEDDGKLDFNFTQEELSHAETWFNSLPIPEGMTPFAVCTGGKCALQHWPLERYAEVLKKIVPEHRLFPIFFGGPADRADADFLIGECGAGLFADDTLTLREKILALRNCAFYLGNNTGVMHLAGAAGIGGFGLSSARDPQKYWQPLSPGLQLLEADVPCRGCRLTTCAKPQEKSCIRQISVQQVSDQTERLLKCMKQQKP